MWPLLIICLLLALAYTVLIIFYRVGWQLQATYKVPAAYVPETRISIVIAARNESDGISACLSSILNQHYPENLFDVTVVDDFSEDDTAEKVLALKAPNVSLVSLKDYVADRSVIRSFKKKALGIAIEHTTGELIVTTDADCLVTADWLLAIAALYEESQAAMIVAPVDFICNDYRPVTLFQSLDFMTMQGITAAVHRLRLGNMSNGANLAFTRAAYQAVSGYDGIDHLASGDDFLLMGKIRVQFPDRIQYLKSEAAIVRTLPQPDWKAFLQQRIRWASKSGKYSDPKLTATLLIVYLFNFSFAVMLVAGLFNNVFILLAGLLLVWKTLLELCFLWPVARFFGKRKQLLLFPFLQASHILYIILAGFLGYRGRFVWKGRMVE